MQRRPTGTITFLFTDIQGSTQLWEREPAAMTVALTLHDSLVRDTVERSGGYVFKTVGDAFCAAFETVGAALRGAIEAQRALARERWPTTTPLKVRMAIHSGAAQERDDDYFGPTVNRVARLLSAGHGGQTLLSLAAEQLVGPDLPPGTALVDLGEHRLKDLSRAEHIYQLAAEGLEPQFPRLKTLDLRPNNLPVERTPLVGREAEVAQVRALLARDDVRLITLLGPGGTGKTRLGVQVAAESVDEHSAGVFFVPLEAATETDDVVGAIAGALGLQEAGDRSLLDLVCDYLAERQALLVLDNFEQVRDGESLVGVMLDRAPDLKIIVTSRTTLRVYGAHDYLVPPLAVPGPLELRTPAALAQNAAVTLFAQRASAAKPDFVLDDQSAPAVAELCARLDGLPLAIELAAARVRLMPPASMLARLEAAEGASTLRLLTGGSRDLPARQQTLRAAIAWSYELLDEVEQRAFIGLSVFSGGFTFEAAEALCCVGPLDLDLFETIASLLDKSLLRQDERQGEPRFVMLQTIREFGLEQLERSGARELQARHAEYFRTLALRAAPELHGRELLLWLERLELEHDNLRSALGWFRAEGEVQRELELASALSQFWLLRNHLSEGRRRLAQALALPMAREYQPVAARALLGLGQLAQVQADFVESGARLAEAAELFEQLGETSNLAICLAYLGQRQVFLGNLAEAELLLTRAETLARQSGDSWALALTLFFGSNAALMTNDTILAAARSSESLALFRRLGEPWGIGLPLYSLGRVALQDGEFDAARSSLLEALDLRRAIGDRWGGAHILNSLGDLSRRESRHDKAEGYYLQAQAAFRDAGNRNGLASVQQNLGFLAQRRGDQAQALDLFRSALRLFHDLGDRRGMAECLAGLAGSLGRSGHWRRAARLLAASETALDLQGAAMSGTNLDEHLQNLEERDKHLDEADRHRFWAEGAVLNLEQAVAEALTPLAEESAA